MKQNQPSNYIVDAADCPLTDRQQEVLDYIKLYQHEEGMPPTRVEIIAAFGFKSPNAAQDHLIALHRKGRIHLVPNISRGIKIL